MSFTTSAAPFSTWHRMHGQAVCEWGYPQWVPWWEAMLWQRWVTLPQLARWNDDENEAVSALYRLQRFGP